MILVQLVHLYAVQVKSDFLIRNMEAFDKLTSGLAVGHLQGLINQDLWPATVEFITDRSSKLNFWHQCLGVHSLTLSPKA